ncbi:MAG: hypothetical protein AAF628_16705 [Planctomycetota bacterium]
MVWFIVERSRHAAAPSSGRAEEGAHPAGGSAMLVLLFAMVVIAGLSTMIVARGTTGHDSSQRATMRARLLQTAESGLAFNLVSMQRDPLYAVKDIAGFTHDATDESYVSPPLVLDSAFSRTKQTFTLRLQYLMSATLGGRVPVTFADRANPVELWDQIKVICSADDSRVTRRIVSWYEEAAPIRGVVMSDMLAIGPSTGTDKTAAKDGHLCFGGGGLTPPATGISVFGNLVANGDIKWFPDVVSTSYDLDAISALTYLNAFAGTIEPSLGGTLDELPDYTAMAAPVQLFDFDRFEAAARGGAGRVYDYGDFDTFLADVAAANQGIGDPLEGIIVVYIEDATVPVAPAWHAGGINVKGTLVWRFEPAVLPHRQVEMNCPVSINAANLSGVTWSDPATFATGYPPVFTTTTPKPWEVDISATTVNGRGPFANFSANDDFPAIMFDHAVVDLHGPANICGVVYTPSLLEVEFRTTAYTAVDHDGDALADTWAMYPVGGSIGLRQYINGAVYAGGGALFRTEVANSHIVLNYDLQTVDNLPYVGLGPVRELQRTGFAIIE